MDTRRCASKDAGSEGSGLGVPHRLEKGMSASEDAGPRREVDWEVPYRLEKRMSASEDARPRRGWIVRSHIGWEGERSIFL